MNRSNSATSDPGPAREIRAVHRSALLCGISALLFLFTAAPAASQSRGPATRPSTVVNVENCVSSECHVEVKEHRFVHGPVAVDACDACHVVEDARQHTFRAPREKQEMCTYCHEFDVSTMSPNVHDPVKRGDCLGCHHPHGGVSRQMTRERSTAELCARCHDERALLGGRTFLHGPVARGACDSCHAPHASRFPKMLDVVGSDLCLTCHTHFGAALSQAKHNHEALKQGCAKCHDAHGSRFPNATTQPIEIQCTGCHEPTRAQVAEAVVPHSAATQGRSCMNCHTAHGGDFEKLMTGTQATVCLGCHAEPLRKNDGRVLPGMANAMSVDLHRHGAIKEGRCDGCHEAHGGGGQMLLARPAARSFYERFEAGKYELCFASCHDVRLAREERLTDAPGVTGFRDGERNLHYVHVASGRRSHSCAVCHEPHVSTSELLLRERIPYGIWQLPMRFRRTESGASCTPGCHVAYGYDRVNPLGPTTLPIDPRPAMPVARAEEESRAELRFEAVDTSGNRIAVPPAEAGTLSVVLIAGASESVDGLRAMCGAVPGDSSGRQILRLLVFAGEAARARAQAFEASVDATGWRVVADEPGTAVRELDVAGWPTAMLVRSDGTLAARVGGSPAVIAIKLAGYLSDAGAGADTRPATEVIVHDTHPVRVSRDLQAARYLLDRGDAAAASRLLQAIPFDAVHADDREVLLARIELAADDWAAARARLEALVTVSANPPTDARLLLGKVYERANELERAVEQYRLGAESHWPRR